MLTTSDEADWYWIKSQINDYYNLSLHYHKQNYHATEQIYYYFREFQTYSLTIIDMQTGSLCKLTNIDN